MNNNKVEGYSRKKKITQIYILSQQKAFLSRANSFKQKEKMHCGQKAESTLISTDHNSPFPK